MKFPCFRFKLFVPTVTNYSKISPADKLTRFLPELSEERSRGGECWIMDVECWICL